MKKILKFGGSSVADASAIQQAITIVNTTRLATPDCAVVVSALSGVTDQLIELSHLACTGDIDYKTLFTNLKNQHMAVAQDLISDSTQREFLEQTLENPFIELEEILNGMYLLREASVRSMDLVMSFGERLSATIIAAAMNVQSIPAEYLDARLLVVTNDDYGNARVEMTATTTRIKDYFSKHTTLQIITGFIGATIDNVTTTLGRGGSDYTLSIFGSALDVESVEIWTDVSGVMTADPRRVPMAYPIKTMTYHDIMEMSHFGAKVVYPPTITPLANKQIPIYIKNTFAPQDPGTCIQPDVSERARVVTGISSITNVTLLQIQGIGISDGVDYAEKIFTVLAQHHIRVFLITQASSEYSLSLVIESTYTTQAQKALNTALHEDITQGRIEPIQLEEHVAIVALIGEQMRKMPGISGKLFTTLGRHGVNIRAIAQGSSEYNISVVIAAQDEIIALRAVHAAFFEEAETSVYLIGTGLIGSTLLEQIRLHASNKIRVAGIANSTQMFLTEAKIDLTDWKFKLDSALSLNLDEFIAHMPRASILVDCTANQDIADRYVKVLAQGCSVVTPNKKANSSSLEYYRLLRYTAQKERVQFCYETNVGAGLPVISTLQQLLASGDSIIRIEGILSGTLSYIFNTFDGSQPFSELVRQAQQQGYTEPDPRDDLNGMDVARKILILAREIGLELELKDITVENLVSEEARSANSVEDFYSILKKYDTHFQKLISDAQSQQRVLRYIAKIVDGKAVVKLETVNQQHPFYQLAGSDNIIAFTTTYYATTPLVIKGPGAGAAVTAAGVLGDILHIVQNQML